MNIITRAEDAPKINRIMERFHLIIPEKGDALKSDTADDLRREIDPEQLLEEVLSENPREPDRKQNIRPGKAQKQKRDAGFNPLLRISYQLENSWRTTAKVKMKGFAIIFRRE